MRLLDRLIYRIANNDWHGFNLTCEPGLKVYGENQHRQTALIVAAS
jgi:hypothetical protein